MNHSESDIQALIQIEGPRHGCILLRNNSGALPDQNGRIVRFGLGNVSKLVNDRMKSSDLIGPTSITITPDMVGKKIAVFTAIEVKEPGWKYMETPREIAQNNFIKWVKDLGGLAGFASSVEDYIKIMRGA